MSEIRCPHCGGQFTIDESGYAAIVQQVRDKEFYKQVKEREDAIQREMGTQLALARQEVQAAMQDAIAKRDTELASLNGRMSLQKAEYDAQLRQALSGKDTEIQALQSQLGALNTKLVLTETSMRENYEAQLRSKDEQIAQYRDFKARQSTKMVGESLERHCEIEFNRVRGFLPPGVYFEKDNDARTGSKGDFIYREMAPDGSEPVSIMFEMKNEMDDTNVKQKHKNEDFFKELDKDRREKRCEYAILVSMLEIDNDLYNQGIVDVSHRYPKMYVVRPQCFIPMITVLRNAAMESAAYRMEVNRLRSQNIDVTRFEEKLLDFQDKFGRNYRLAHDKLSDAVADIDRAIASLEKTKKELISSDNNYRLANDKLEDLSVRKLTAGNPTMTQMFAQAGALPGGTV